MSVEAHVLGHGELEEEASVLGHEGDAGTRHDVGAAAPDRLSEDPHVAADDRKGAGNRPQRGALAGAVRTEKGHQLTALHVQVQTSNGSDAGVSGHERLYLDRAHRAVPVKPLPDAMDTSRDAGASSWSVAVSPTAAPPVLPRYASTTRGFTRICDGVPSAMSEPNSRT